RGSCPRRFSPEATLHVTGTASADTPLAWGPRNCGQFVSVAPANPALASRRPKQTNDSNWRRLGFMEDRTARLSAGFPTTTQTGPFRGTSSWLLRFLPQPGFRRRDLLPGRGAPSLPWWAGEDHVPIGTPSGCVQ